MKHYSAPELKLFALSVNDIITASGTPATTAAPTTAPVTAAPTTAAPVTQTPDPGIDNTVSAKNWAF